MIILFSPAKTFNPTNQQAVSTPVFQNRALELMTKLKKTAPEKIKSHMKLSEALLSRVLGYHDQFNQELKPAIYTYMGQAYKALDVYHFTDTHIKRLSERVYILSALYGILKPLDAISYYRLDFTHHLLGNLLHYWKKPVNDYLDKNHEDDVIVNLASLEFSQLINTDKHIVTLQFLTKKNQILKANSMHIKTMRGLVLRHMILYDIKTLEDIKKITIDHYHYDASLSDEHTFTFIKTT